MLASRVRAPYCAVIQGALISTGLITLTTWQFLRGYGLRSDNASMLPNNYALGLSIVVAAAPGSLASLEVSQGRYHAAGWPWRHNARS